MKYPSLPCVILPPPESCISKLDILGGNALLGGRHSRLTRVGSRTSNRPLLAALLAGVALAQALGDDDALLAHGVLALVARHQVLAVRVALLAHRPTAVFLTAAVAHDAGAAIHVVQRDGYEELEPEGLGPGRRKRTKLMHARVGKKYFDPSPFNSPHATKDKNCRTSQTRESVGKETHHPDFINERGETRLTNGMPLSRQSHGVHRCSSSWTSRQQRQRLSFPL